MSLPIHPLADLFPLIEGVEFEELVHSIKAHGLWDPITLLGGAILDGRNRYRACQTAGVEPRFESFDGDDPYAFVADKNLHRRHLNQNQLGIIGARMAKLRIGNPTFGKPIVDGNTIAPSTEQVADMLGISRSTVQNAKVVLNEGTAEEIKAVEQGASAKNIAQNIRDRAPEKNRLNEKKGHIGKNPERFEDHRMKAKIWADMRAVIDGISGLPLPSDCVAIARRFDRQGLVDTRLIPAIEWLKEFSNEWIKRNGSSGEEVETSSDHADAGTGDRAA